MSCLIITALLSCSDEKIDGSVIMDITDLTTLKQMGIKIGPAVNISRHIKGLSQVRSKVEAIVSSTVR